MILNKLTLFDHLKDDIILKCLNNILDDMNIEESYFTIIRLLLERQQSLSEYMIFQMLRSDNKKLSIFGTREKLSQFELSCLSHDLEILSSLFQLNIKDVCHKASDKNQLLYKLENYDEEIPDDISELFKTMEDQDYLIQSYLGVLKDPMEQSERLTLFKGLLYRFGVGPFVLYPGFTVHEEKGELRFKGISEIFTLEWDNIYHYQLQKESLYKNTKAFVEGRSFQNVLLVGASGTGKSTSVKSIVNEFLSEKLRLIQMQKGQLHLLPEVIDYVNERGFKFILFIDDLSFEANEDEYKFLKSFIEGSISVDTSQVAFYVTSNRRHLIKEIRSERENDIHLQDFIQEMTSLSDRFGLTLLYESLVQKEYLQMVKNMYDKLITDDEPKRFAKVLQTSSYKLNQLLSDEELFEQARIYALRHGKMSGRVALQFIKQLGV